MRSLPPSTTSTWTPKSETKSENPASDDRMIGLFDRPAEVVILNSQADDSLAAAMYGGAKRLRKKKDKKKPPKNGISGYDFDSLIPENGTSEPLTKSKKSKKSKRKTIYSA